MGNVFGRKSRPSRVTEQDRAILQLKQQRDKLKHYQKRVTLQLEKERSLAKQLLKDGKKEICIYLVPLDRKHSEFSKTVNHLSVQDIEFVQIEMKVIEGLKVGNDCLKSMHEAMSLEDVERIMDETQDAVEYQRQIDEMLSGSLTQEDEDAVLSELEAITQVCIILSYISLLWLLSELETITQVCIILGYIILLWLLSELETHSGVYHTGLHQSPLGKIPGGRGWRKTTCHGGPKHFWCSFLPGS
uniref:Charged multivesicular body protein 6 n=1 Tax=Hucho hucho TaxID=62062 RepID=A0A4W5Q062_9TELE